jgi:L,D-transpeptidase catalytic domain
LRFRRAAVFSRGFFPDMHLHSLPLFSLLLFGCVSCAVRDREHRIVISVPDQKMVVLKNDAPIAEYPVSTSKFCESDLPGSKGTPLGALEIAKKIGGNAPAGMKFKDRKPTGEIVPADAPGRDPIVSRILWLRGLEPQNANAYSRYIYIHGTAEESKIGTPASYGCIRMRSADVIQLYNTVGIGARVEISEASLTQLMPQSSVSQTAQQAQAQPQTGG